MTNSFCLRSATCLLTLAAGCSAAHQSQPPPSAPAEEPQVHTQDPESDGSEAGGEPAETLPQAKTGGDCGGMMGASCNDGQFCLYQVEDSCGAADQMGTCTELPALCTLDFRPVCGCDDKTYSNACKAHAKGVSVARDGECEPRTLE